MHTENQKPQDPQEIPKEIVIANCSPAKQAATGVCSFILAAMLVYGAYGILGLGGEAGEAGPPLMLFLLFGAWVMIAYGVYCIRVSRDPNVHFIANQEGLDINYPVDAGVNRLFFAYSTYVREIPWEEFKRFFIRRKRVKNHEDIDWYLEYSGHRIWIPPHFWEEDGETISENIAQAQKTYRPEID